MMFSSFPTSGFSDASAAIGDSSVARVESQVLGDVDRGAAQTSEVRSLRDLVEELGEPVDPPEPGN